MELGEVNGRLAIESAGSALGKPPATTDQPKPEVAAPKTATGSLGGPSVGQQQTETLRRADARIAEGAELAGITLRPTANHVDRVINAVAVYNKLAEQVSYAPEMVIKAATFLADMGNIGEKFGMNFGLNTKPSKDEPEGIPLNQGKFAGIDYQQATERLKADTELLREQNKGAGKQTPKEPLWVEKNGSAATQPPAKTAGSVASLPQLDPQQSPETDPKAQAQAFIDKVITPGEKSVTTAQLQSAIDTKGLLSPAEKTVASKVVAGMKAMNYPEAPVDAVMQRLPEMFKDIQAQSPSATTTFSPRPSVIRDLPEAGTKTAIIAAAGKPSASAIS